jgi:hypothetical protein
MVTSDFGVAYVFQQSKGSENVVFRMIQYVGILKHILKLDYGSMFSPIVLSHCNWVKNGTNNRGNPTYKQDNPGFFRHLLHEVDEPFIFPSQIQQVFFKNDPKMPFWKVVFHREPRSRIVVANTFDDCIDMHAIVSRLELLLEFLDRQ